MWAVVGESFMGGMEQKLDIEGQEGFDPEAMREKSIQMAMVSSFS